MIQDKTKINRRNQGQETIIKEEVIGIFFFNIIILVAPKGAVLLVVLKKTSVVPLAIYQDSPPLVEGDHLVQAL